MNYEQRYKEALEKARDYFKANQRIGELEENDILSDIFPELKEPEDKKIKETLIELVKCNERCGYSLLNNVSTNSMLAWIEKQGEQIDIANKEYWRGYREGKKEILDKYAELEKQDKQNTNILWHDVSEEPEMYRELLCEWYAKGDINHITSFHDVAFYHTNSKTFWNGEQQIYNVVKWAYVDEIL